MKTEELVNNVKRLDFVGSVEVKNNKVTIKGVHGAVLAEAATKTLHQVNTLTDGFEELPPYQRDRLNKDLTEYGNTPIVQRDEGRIYLIPVIGASGLLDQKLLYQGKTGLSVRTFKGNLNNIKTVGDVKASQQGNYRNYIFREVRINELKQSKDVHIKFDNMLELENTPKVTISTDLNTNNDPETKPTN